MLKLESSKMQKAIARAKQMKPRVRMTGERVYSVSGSRGNAYTVTFSVANGMKLGACTCPAGEAGQMCYHIAAAAAVNIAIQTMRKAAAQQAASAPQPETVATDERAQLITDIRAAWQRARPFASLEGAVRQVFGVAKLEDVATEDLRKVLAALTPRARKDFTPSERVAIGKQIEKILANRQGQRNDLRGKDLQLVGYDPQVAGEKTRDVVAQRAGFGSARSYKSAKKVTEKGAPELIEAMDTGLASISAAAQLATLPIGNKPRRPSLPYHHALDACASGRGSLTRFYQPSGERGTPTRAFSTKGKHHA